MCAVFRPIRLASVLTLVGVLSAGCGDDGTNPPAEVDGGIVTVWRTPLDSIADNVALSDPATDGTRLFVLAAGAVRAFDGPTGAALWRTPSTLNGPVNLIALNGRVLYAGAEAVSLDGATGNTNWRITLPNSSLARNDADAAALYIGSDDHRVSARSITDGHLLWTTDVGSDWGDDGYINGVGVSGDTVYAGAERLLDGRTHSVGYTVALNRQTGALFWKTANGGGGDRRSISTAPVVSGGIVLASDARSDALIGLDRLTGVEKWRITGGSSEPPTVQGGTAYVGSATGTVLAIDPATGARRWSRNLPDVVTSLALCNDRVMALTRARGLSVLNRADGALLATLYDRNKSAEGPSAGLAVFAPFVFTFGDKAAYGLRCP